MITNSIFEKDSSPADSYHLFYGVAAVPEDRYSLAITVAASLFPYQHPAIASS